MVEISLLFDSSARKYSPGDVINLEARIQTSFNQKYRSIYARIRGYSHVEWTESRQVKRNDQTHTEYTTYSSDETFIQHYQTLAGSKEGPEMRLPVGTHVYHARIALPRNIPESHENEYGHIRYEVKVHMDVPWGSDEKELLPIYIKPRFDLNEFPHLREPVRAGAHKTFGFCCWESDPLHIYNVLPRSGFVLGDRVQFSIEMNNESDVAVNGADVELVEIVSYHANNPSSNYRERHRTLWSHNFSGNNGQLVAALQNKVFATELHFSPYWDLHCFTGCRNISVEYYLQSKVITSGCHSNLSSRTTITMGTISLGNFGSDEPTPMAPMMPFPSAPLAPMLGLPSAPALEPICEQQLPSYDDAAQSKPSKMGPGNGWAATSNLETPPPTFTEIQFTDEKEKQ